MSPVPHVGSSDHFSVLAKPTIPCNFRSGSKVSVKSRVMDHNSKVMFVHSLRNTDWSPLYRVEFVTDKLDLFNNTMNDLINDHFPMKDSKRHSSDKPWVTDAFRSLINERQLALHHKNSDRYRLLRNRINRLSKSLKVSFYKNNVASLKKENPHKWWSSIKTLTYQNNQSTNPLLGLANDTADGNLTTLASKINNFFCSVSSVLEPLSPENAYSTIVQPQIEDKFIISIHDVEKQLLKVNPRKAKGPDGIPNWIIKDLAGILAPPICNIFNASIQSGIVPPLWKSADVVSLPKKFPPKEIEQDLRPISLTPLLSKLLEDYPVMWMWEALEGKVDPNQFGCLKKCSTTFALLQLMDLLYKETDGAKNFARVLLLDYRKAFDLIDHSILLKKLENLEVPPVLLRWIASFLTSRTQRVKINNNTMSEWGHLNGGVPQGTKLGPILFLCMINDLSLDIPTFKYVDDTSAVHISNDPLDNALQTAADSAAAWSENMNMQLNAKKTKELVIDFGNPGHSLPPITINGEEIERVKSSKLLGVHLSHD